MPCNGAQRSTHHRLILPLPPRTPPPALWLPACTQLMGDVARARAELQQPRLKLMALTVVQLRLLAKAVLLAPFTLPAALAARWRALFAGSSYENFLMSEGEKIWAWRNRTENERWFWEVLAVDRWVGRRATCHVPHSTECCKSGRQRNTHRQHTHPGTAAASAAPPLQHLAGCSSRSPGPSATRPSCRTTSSGACWCRCASSPGRTGVSQAPDSWNGG